MNFQLDQQTVSKVKEYCDYLYESNRKFGVKDSIIDKNRSGKEINLQGLGAEVWYKKKYNIPFNLDATKENLRPRSYKTDIDCIREGLNLELKQTSYFSGCLFLPATDHYSKPRKLLADMYVLVVGSFPNYEKDLHISVLSITKKFFVKESNMLKPTKHSRMKSVGYHMEQDEMYETFEKALEANGNSKPKDASAVS